MDPFSLARAKARQTRKTRAAGVVEGYDAVEAALTSHGFLVNPVPPTDGNLSGVDANVDRAFSLASVRNDVSREMQAYHLAHELGHVDLHRPDQACELADADLGAAGSRALSRVESYGPRERRELQANVYAREFLLPREQARRLFLSERLSASEIALRVGMPHREVRRQLVDSLLRPDDEPVWEVAPTVEVDLDLSQRRAVEFTGPALLLEAGPGSGKTRTLVERVNHLLASAVQPAQILALTFSNKAAAEMATRIAERRPTEAVEVWTGTFHAFGLEIMRRHYDRMGLTPKVRMLSPSQAIEMLEERLPVMNLRHFHDLRDPGLKLKELMKPIHRAKDEMVDKHRFRFLADLELEAARATYAAASGKATEQRLTKAEKTLEAAAVYDQYDALLRDNGFVDFADLIMGPTLLMEGDEAVRETLRERHVHVLVDEYQDVNRASARMLKALYGPDNHLWVVGDARQSIYRWRGASSLNMGEFENDFGLPGRPSPCRQPLGFNYRSTAHVTGLCRTFAGTVDAKRPPPPTGRASHIPYAAEHVRGDVGSMTKHFVGRDDECEADLLAAEIKRLVAMEAPFGSQTVLARSNARLDALSSQLALRGVPTLHLGSFFEREEVRDVLSVLALIAEPNGAALVRIAAIREVDIGATDIAAFVTAARDRGVPLALLLPDADAVPGITSEGAIALKRLGRRLKNLSPRTPAFEAASTWLLDRSDYLRDLAASDGVQADLSRAAILQLLAFLDQVEADGTMLTTSAALRRVRTVVMLSDDRDLREPDLGADVNAVRLMTVHAAKGLQFPAVHVVGLHEQGFPAKRQGVICDVPPGVVDEDGAKDAHAEEEACAFFVAISRAEDHLRLYRTEVAKTQPRKPSSYLAALGIGVTERLGSVPALSPATAPVAVPLSIDRISIFDIIDYEKCPLKVAYRHRFSLRARRHEGAYLKTETILRTIIDELSSTIGTGGNVRKDIEVAFERSWRERGPTDSPMHDEYLGFARTRISSLATLVTGYAGTGHDKIDIPLGNGSLRLTRPVQTRDAAGGLHLRFVSLKRPSVDHAKGLATRLLATAAHAIGGEPRSVDFAFVEGGADLVVRTAAERSADIAAAGQVLAAIRSGDLPPKPEMRTCLRCGHFHSCPATGGRHGSRQGADLS